MLQQHSMGDTAARGLESLYLRRGAALQARRLAGSRRKQQVLGQGECMCFQHQLRVFVGLLGRAQVSRGGPQLSAELAHCPLWPPGCVRGRRSEGMPQLH